MNTLFQCATQKPTGKPVHYHPVGSDILGHGIQNLEKSYRSIDFAALGIQCFALMFLLVYTKDLVKTIGFALGGGEFVVEFLDSSFEPNLLLSSCTLACGKFVLEFLNRFVEIRCFFD